MRETQRLGPTPTPAVGWRATLADLAERVAWALLGVARRVRGGGA